MKTIKYFVLLTVLLITTVAFAQALTGYTKIGTSSTTTFTDTSCPNLTGCYYVVTAMDSAGFESVPSACSATALCLGGNQVIALMPSSGTHTVTLTWTASPASGATYNIYRHIGPLAASNVSVTVN